MRVLSHTPLPVLAAAAIVLTARTLYGPLPGPIPVHSPLNAESAVAICVLLLAVLGRRRPGAVRPQGRESARSKRLAGAGLLLLPGLIAAVFWPALDFPFLSDDYVLLASRRPDTQAIHDLFMRGGGDGFFRPVGDLSLAATAPWAGGDPGAWHAVALALHLANCCLLYALARRLNLSTWACLAATGIFGLHGTRVEAVSWMAARFDLTMTFFFLAAALFFLLDAGRPRNIYFFGCLVCTLLALLSKESAYSFALFAALLLVASGRRSRRGWAVVFVLLALESIVFAYRWRLFGGMGGYIDLSTGRPMFLTLRLLGIFKTLGWRSWAILFFPINWSDAPALELKVAMAGWFAVLFAFARSGRGRSRYLLGIGMILVLMLPGFQLLLLGQDLAGSRCYYLPVAGFAILCSFFIDSLERTSLRIGATALALVFFAMTLRHDIRPWGRVSKLAAGACSGAASQMRDDRLVAVEGLPQKIDGVFYFRNGFAECISLYLHCPPGCVREARRCESDAAVAHFRWLESDSKLVRVE